MTGRMAACRLTTSTLMATCWLIASGLMAACWPIASWLVAFQLVVSWLMAACRQMASGRLLVLPLTTNRHCAEFRRLRRRRKRISSTAVGIRWTRSGRSRRRFWLCRCLVPGQVRRVEVLDSRRCRVMPRFVLLRRWFCWVAWLSGLGDGWCRFGKIWK